MPVTQVWSKPQKIPFPTTTNPGIRAQESGGRIINGYIDAQPETAKERIIHHRQPGLSVAGTTARTGFRGMIEIGGVAYAAFSGQLEKWTTTLSGASTNVGALSGTKKGFFARNNAATPDKVFVDPDGNIATFTPTAVTAGYPDADLPAVNACCGLDGYIVFTTGSGRAYATDLNSTAVNPLSFGAAEGKPDALTRPVPWSGMLLLFGPVSCEVWTNQGTSPFPFARSVVIPRGIAGPYCVTGHEDGFGKALFIIGDDDKVHQLEGYAFKEISPPDLDALIAAVTDKSQLDLCSFISRGNAFVQVSGPTFSWLYHVNKPAWYERRSNGLTYSRIVGSAKIFNKWFTGDRSSGNVPEITHTTAQETGNPLIWQLDSGPTVKFPIGTRVGRVDFDFTTGVGIADGIDPIQRRPKVMISWSDDGAQTYTAELELELGMQSKPEQIVSLVGGLGRSTWHGRRWRVKISDPVDVGFSGGRQAENPRLTG